MTIVETMKKEKMKRSIDVRCVTFIRRVRASLNFGQKERVKGKDEEAGSMRHSRTR